MSSHEGVKRGQKSAKGFSLSRRLRRQSRESLILTSTCPRTLVFSSYFDPTRTRLHPLGSKKWGQSGDTCPVHYHSFVGLLPPAFSLPIGTIWTPNPANPTRGHPLQPKNSPKAQHPKSIVH